MVSKKEKLISKTSDYNQQKDFYIFGQQIDEKKDQ